MCYSTGKYIHGETLNLSIRIYWFECRAKCSRFYYTFSISTRIEPRESHYIYIIYATRGKRTHTHSRCECDSFLWCERIDFIGCTTEKKNERQAKWTQKLNEHNINSSVSMMPLHMYELTSVGRWCYTDRYEHRHADATFNNNILMPFFSILACRVCAEGT